jgi:hypothetical protein
MARTRLQALQDLAEAGALFAHEYAALGQPVPDAALHANYAQDVGQMIAFLAAPARSVACQRR